MRAAGFIKRLEASVRDWIAKGLHVSDTFWEPARNEFIQVVTLNVRYGIENYFVPEGEGLALERPKPDEKVTIRVAVDRAGNAGIKAVLVNGTPRYEEKLF
ncbi:MAG: GDYXXLXY domain-containing protein [Burkholderiales bacterium]